MSRNLYDEPAFLAGYSSLPRSLHGLAGAPEWPRLRAMLPAVPGKRIVDHAPVADRWIKAVGKLPD